MSKKVSGMLLGVAWEYLDLGQDIEDKQQLLFGAVSAWNIACMPPGQRIAALREFMQEYERMNQAQSAQDFRDVEENMRLLMERKRELYPDVRVQIIGARVEDREGQLYVEVATVREAT